MASAFASDRRPAKSPRWAYTPPAYPGESATALVMLASSEGIPMAVSTGKVTSVPPPATELTNPPPMPPRREKKSASAPRSFMRREASHAARGPRRGGYGTTRTGAIMPWSSWKRMWQCTTNRPVKSRNRCLMTTLPPGGTGTTSA